MELIRDKVHGDHDRIAFSDERPYLLPAVDDRSARRNDQDFFPVQLIFESSAGSAVINGVILVFLIQLIRIRSVKYRLFPCFKARQNMIDIPVCQIPFFQIMFRVVPMKIESGREKIGRCIAPFGLPLQGHDVLLNRIHHRIDVIGLICVIVQIVRDQLYRQIPRVSPHTHQAGVYGRRPAQMHVHKALRETGAQ